MGGLTGDPPPQVKWTEFVPDDPNSLHNFTMTTSDEGCSATTVDVKRGDVVSVRTTASGTDDWEEAIIESIDQSEGQIKYAIKFPDGVIWEDMPREVRRNSGTWCRIVTSMTPAQRASATVRVDRAPRLCNWSQCS